ncbi:hypothetical protein BG844_14430 [Couchioplanes caeruleus subsp. caeruleus]|uniref:Uncharacterized protein n=1 Tax=Couchioplanes caeruleus subsp. caeruleus TaxID=56427 RepID=A0A1K0G8J2_9ACTN|nr:hypothetical protein BG844_14430 [Couchioplanes caeruleus subsp. caeruleus]
MSGATLNWSRYRGFSVTVAVYLPSVRSRGSPCGLLPTSAFQPAWMPQTAPRLNGLPPEQPRG